MDCQLVCKGIHYFLAAQGGTVFDHNYLKLGIGLRKETAQQVLDFTRSIVNRNDAGKEHQKSKLISSSILYSGSLD